MMILKLLESTTQTLQNLSIISKRKVLIVLVCIAAIFGVSAIAVAVQISLDSPATLPSDI